MANQQQPWFQSDPNAGMRKRVEEIAKLRDPGTFADEILIGSRALLVLSLLFTGALCFFSYKFFLERFLDPFPAIAAAIAVTILIEYGKARIGMAALRMPFMQGWRFIFSTQENTVMFAGASLFAVTIFSISVYNSTNGAARYAEQTATQKTEVAFQTNTANIDEEIQRTQKRLDEAPKYKWKGREYYQDPKSVRAAENTLASLQKQREEATTQQRADFERTRNNNDTANQHSAGIALRVGGWLELIQVILMFLRASCERVLDRRNPAGRQTGNNNTTNPQIGFNRPVTAQHEPLEQNPPPPPTKPIGFKQYDQPQASATTAATQPPPVPQTAQGVAQTNGLLRGKEADDAIKFHLSKLKKEPANFSNKHARPETVSKRITDVLSDMVRTLHGVQQCSNEVYMEVRNYLDNTLIPALVDKGFFYDTRELYTLLYQRAGEGAGHAN